MADANPNRRDKQCFKSGWGRLSVGTVKSFKKSPGQIGAVDAVGKPAFVWKPLWKENFDTPVDENTAYFVNPTILS
jgi:hypothetical protein